MGSTGATGSAGTTGAAGSPGVGAWNAETLYVPGDAVDFEGTSYVAINFADGIVPFGRSKLVRARGQRVHGRDRIGGHDGCPGSQGIVGVTGSKEPTGINRLAGVTGAPGVAWLGAWSWSTTYNVADAVNDQGSTYIALNSNLIGSGTEPLLDVSDWSLLVAAGATGRSAVGCTSSGAAHSPDW